MQKKVKSVPYVSFLVLALLVTLFSVALSPLINYGVPSGLTGHGWPLAWFSSYTVSIPIIGSLFGGLFGWAILWSGLIFDVLFFFLAFTVLYRGLRR